MNAANEGVSRAESIRKFEILPDEFTEANGMLTPSLKTRRAQIVEHYRELIVRRDLRAVEEVAINSL